MLTTNLTLRMMLSGYRWSNTMGCARTSSFLTGPPRATRNLISQRHESDISYQECGTAGTERTGPPQKNRSRCVRTVDRPLIGPSQARQEY
jgi:hypothetical protein